MLRSRIAIFDLQCDADRLVQDHGGMDSLRADLRDDPTACLLYDNRVETIGSTDESGSDGLAKAAWLFNTFASTIHTSGTGAQAAGLQVAIW